MNKLEKEISELIKCIDSDCDNNGSIAIKVDDGQGGFDVEAEQCQYCFEVRFPLIQSILKLIQERDEKQKGIEVEMCMVNGIIFMNSQPANIQNEDYRLLSSILNPNQKLFILREAEKDSEVKDNEK